HARLMAARTAPESLAAKDESNLLIDVARALEDFIGALFWVRPAAAALPGAHVKLAPLYDCKRLFVQRYVTRAIKPDAAAAIAPPVIDLPVRLAAEREGREIGVAA